MEQFARKFRERLESVLQHGQQKKLAEHLGVHANEVGRWGNQRNNNWQVPTVYEAARAAEFLNINPAWLAFGIETPEVSAEDAAVLKILHALTPEQYRSVAQIAAQFVKQNANAFEAEIKGTGVQTSAVHLVPPRPAPVLQMQTERITTPAGSVDLTAFSPPPKSKPLNRRGDYQLVPVFDAPSKGAQRIPQFEAVAAGFGEDLELSDDLVYVRELPDWQGVHSVVVRGDSMLETLVDKDLVLVRSFRDGEGITLDAMEEHGIPTPYRKIQHYIPNDEIFILSIDGEPPTIKRVLYAIESETRWHLIVKADNPAHPQHHRVLRREQPIRFYGRLMAIGARQYSTHKPMTLSPALEKKFKRKK